MDNKQNKNKQNKNKKTVNDINNANSNANNANNVFKEYRYIIILLVLILIFGLIYTNSRNYLVNQTIKKFNNIESYQNISDNKIDENTSLNKLKINSSYNCIGRYRCLFDYQDTKILSHILRLGCRYIELNIFPDTFKYGSTPVVTNGLKQGQWKLMLNGVRFSQYLKVIKDNAFTKLSNLGGVPNPDDPLFLGLNLHTGYNIKTLDDVAEKIIRELGNYLLPAQYSYQYDDKFYDIKIGKLKKKLVIFASSGFEGSKLEEIVNASWVDDTKLNTFETFTNYLSNPIYENFEATNKDIFDNLVENSIKKKHILRISAATINSYGFNTQFLTDYNKTGLTIVVPNIEGDIFPMNYDPTSAWNLGCQFVCMNYQLLNSNLDKYIMAFRSSSIKEI